MYKITHDCGWVFRQLKSFYIQCSLFSLTPSLTCTCVHLHTAQLCILAYSHYDGRLLFVSDFWMEYDFILYGYWVLLLMILTWQRLSSNELVCCEVGYSSIVVYTVHTNIRSMVFVSLCMCAYMLFCFYFACLMPHDVSRIIFTSVFFKSKQILNRHSCDLRNILKILLHFPSMTTRIFICTKSYVLH